MPVPISNKARLRAALDRLSDAVGALSFDLVGPDNDRLANLRDRVRRLIDRHLEPRLASSDAPLLVAVFGPTGGGKSTLINSIAGRAIGPAGALRPTTRHPVVWCHRVHAHRYRGAGFEEAQVIEDDHPLTRNLTLVDTPDLDSYLVEHRQRTEIVLDSCDAAIFVTTPQRYADAVPWETLHQVLERRLSVLVVANRLSRRSGGAVTDLIGLLRGAGMEVAADGVITIQEQRLRGEGLFPPAAIKRIGRHLDGLAAAPQPVIDRGVAGTIAVVLGEVDALLYGLEADTARAAKMEALARAAVDAQAAEISLHLEQGDLVRSEVVARWQRLVGVSDVAAVVTRGWAKARELVRPPVEAETIATVGEEARAQLVDLLVYRARLAFDQSREGWLLEAGGPPLVHGVRLDDDRCRQVAEAVVSAWYAELVELVGGEGKGRFRIARAASIGVNAAATILLVGVFAHTGGLTGAEVGVVAGAAAAQQAVLEHLFGSATAGRLAAHGRSRLVEGARQVLDEGIAPLLVSLETVTPPRQVRNELADAAQAVADEARVLGHD
jgi:energy-coupling factor transporter ATP-binding protein EcfA2